MTKTRGQIEFGETIMIVIVIVFLIIIGLVFYFAVAERNIGRELSYRDDVNSVVLGKRVLALPEIECPVVQGTACIDFGKTFVLSYLIKGEPEVFSYYDNLFGFATINVVILTDSGTEQIMLYENKPETIVAESRQFLFTSLYLAEVDERQLAYLNITRYTVAR